MAHVLQQIARFWQNMQEKLILINVKVSAIKLKSLSAADAC